MGGWRTQHRQEAVGARPGQHSRKLGPITDNTGHCASAFELGFKRQRSANTVTSKKKKEKEHGQGTEIG